MNDYEKALSRQHERAEMVERIGLVILQVVITIVIVSIELAAVTGGLMWWFS